MPTTQHKRDYYEILGVDRSATRDQIKQAYRKLALKYHPDRNKESGSEEAFKEIAEAYAVLSDDTKRHEYDMTGHAGISERWSPEDLMRGFHFGDFFGGRVDDLSGIFGDLFGRRTPKRDQGLRGKDLRYDLDLTLEEAAKGGEREIEIRRSEKCGICQGSGAKPGTQPKPCSDCSGSGQKQEVQSGEGVRMVSISTCPRCHGRGQFIEHPCATCHGSGTQFHPHRLKVKIPPGIDDGMFIRLTGQGEQHPGSGQPGDLLIRPHLRPHSSLQRQGDDLYSMASLNLVEAALGTTLSINGLEGEPIALTIPPGTQSGTSLRIPGKGMPRLHHKGKGDLYVIVEVRTPTDMTSKQRQLLEEYAILEKDRKRESSGS